MKLLILTLCCLGLVSRSFSFVIEREHNTSGQDDAIQQLKASLTNQQEVLASHDVMIDTLQTRLADQERLIKDQKQLLDDVADTLELQSLTLGVLEQRLMMEDGKFEEIELRQDGEMGGNNEHMGGGYNTETLNEIDEESKEIDEINELFEEEEEEEQEEEEKEEEKEEEEGNTEEEEEETNEEEEYEEEDDEDVEEEVESEELEAREWLEEEVAGEEEEERWDL